MKSAKKQTLALGIVKKLRRSGFQAYFVGGCVRDMIMRKNPQDIDIATNAALLQLKRVFPHRTYPVGVKFGTLLVLRNRIPFQVSSFRGKERSRLLEDVTLRDFTINGLAYDPIERKVIDLVHGKKDIRQKVIRTIGEPSSVFTEDPLRLIRAVRFAVNLRFAIEQKTHQTIITEAKKIERASFERIRDELILIFTGPHPAVGLQLLDKTGLLKYVLPQVAKLKGVRQPRAFHPEGDVFTHTLLMLKQLKNSSLLLAFACLLHDIGKPLTFAVRDRIRFNRHDKVGAQLAQRILKTLRFSNKDRENIVACVENHMRMMEAPKMRNSTLKKLFARPTFEEELKLHHIDCIASHKDLKVWRFLRKKYKEFKNELPIPKPLLNGYELIKIGFTPGRIFGKIHKQMVDLQLEGKLKTKQEAKVWVCKKWLK